MTVATVTRLDRRSRDRRSRRPTQSSGRVSSAVLQTLPGTVARREVAPDGSTRPGLSYGDRLMGSIPEPAQPDVTDAAEPSVSITVSMFVTDWLALVVWLRYQQQTAARHAAALRAVADIVAQFPELWRQPTTRIGDLTAESSSATFTMPASVGPFLAEFGGEPAMAAATRVWIDRQPLPRFAGRPYLI